jgi:hypothetical protein
MKVILAQQKLNIYLWKCILTGVQVFKNVAFSLSYVHHIKMHPYIFFHAYRRIKYHLIMTTPWRDKY